MLSGDALLLEPPEATAHGTARNAPLIAGHEPRRENEIRGHGGYWGWTNHKGSSLISALTVQLHATFRGLNSLRARGRKDGSGQISRAMSRMGYFALDWIS